MPRVKTLVESSNASSQDSHKIIQEALEEDEAKRKACHQSWETGPYHNSEHEVEEGEGAHKHKPNDVDAHEGVCAVVWRGVPNEDGELGDERDGVGFKLVVQVSKPAPSCQ